MPDRPFLPGRSGYRKYYTALQKRRQETDRISCCILAACRPARALLALASASRTGLNERREARSDRFGPPGAFDAGEALAAGSFRVCQAPFPIAGEPGARGTGGCSRPRGRSARCPRAAPGSAARHPNYYRGGGSLVWDRRYSNCRPLGRPMMRPGPDLPSSSKSPEICGSQGFFLSMR